jgi:hypothetical protein
MTTKNIFIIVVYEWCYQKFLVYFCDFLHSYPTTTFWKQRL